MSSVRKGSKKLMHKSSVLGGMSLVPEKMTAGHDCTMECLNHWFKAMHEKLGWMLLAKQYDYTDKVTSYLLTLVRLHNSLLMKQRTTDDKDRKEDLAILLQKLECLKDHATADLTCEKDKVDEADCDMMTEIGRAHV